MSVTKRPNPAVAQATRDAALAEQMARMSPGKPLGGRIAERKRATAVKIRKEHPFLIESE